MLRFRSLLPLAVLVASCAWGCASSEETATTPDADFDGGPITTRPDDGVDSTTVEGGTDTGTTGDSTTGPETSGDTGAAPSDTTAADTKTDAATADTKTASDAATDSATDTAVAAGPKIHEVFCNDITTTGARAAYVEIAAPPGTPLTTLHIRAIKSNGTVAGDWVLSSTVGKVMPASGLWVVGGQSLLSSEADEFYNITSPDNWDIPCTGAIQLNDHSGIVVQNVDVVGYGSVANPTAAPTAISEGGTLAPTSTSGKSIGRKSVPGDTDNNASDFCVMNKSPKAANDTCL